MFGATAVCNPIIYIPIQAGGSGITPDATSPPSRSPRRKSKRPMGSARSTSAEWPAPATARPSPSSTPTTIPTSSSDTATFCTQFGLQQFNVSGGPTLTVLNQTGGTTLPGNAARSVDELVGGGDLRRGMGPCRSPPRPTSSSSRPTAPRCHDLLTAVNTAAARPASRWFR